MKIRELFVTDVTRNIPEVVYFHEQTPEKLQSEVSEYIITGGSAAAKTPEAETGIHEQFVRLLRGIEHELDKPGGPDLPASWISGFYGSGKSSFAKLLGLALDGVTLPNGTPLWSALLARDDSPRRSELVEAWNAVSKRLNSIAVVFDVGAVARDHEQLHAAVLRQVQARLGYCSKSDSVAEYELRLERDGEWETFLVAAKATIGEDWTIAKERQQAEDHFAHVLHRLKPARYPEPTSWFESRGGTQLDSSVRATVESIEAMLELRARGATLFIVVDEVSQYIGRDENRMLKLQSFVSELGQRLKGRAWLLATGQQRLEDATDTALGKLQDRFPRQLRVHLDTTNIRDVVHKRLLAKNELGAEFIRTLFAQGSNRANLKLYGYACEELVEEDFVALYPLLPGHIDLLLQLTSSLRARSSSARGDRQAVRGILQLLGALFREPGFAETEVGALVSFDAIFEVQRAALDADVRTAVSRIVEDARARGDAIAQRVVEVVALLQLIQEQVPTTPELVASCLYARLGEANPLSAVSSALERLLSQGQLSYSAKRGFKLQGSAGQEWQRERDDIVVSQERVGEALDAALQGLFDSIEERVRFKGRSFPWTLWFSDTRRAAETKLKETREASTIPLDLRFVAPGTESAADWVPKSAEKALENRLLWIVAEPASLETPARELARSERMIERYRSRRESLDQDKERLLGDEEARLEELALRLRGAVAEVCMAGSVYFRGLELRPRELGSSFSIALCCAATRALPDLYPHFSELAISEKELAQLLEKELSGPSTKFMEGGLGLLSLDSGKYQATCTGVYPVRVAQELEQSPGVSGQELLATFVSPPWGYAQELVKACCAALLRGRKLRIQCEQGAEIATHHDPGVRDLFSRDREFRRAAFFPAARSELSPKDRITIRKLLQKHLEVEQDPEDEPLTDTVFQSFPGVRERVRQLEQRFDALPGRPPLPVALQRFARALDDCRRSRHVEHTVSALKRHLDALRDGFEQFQSHESEVTAESVAALNRAAHIRDHELLQLQQLGEVEDLEGAASAIVQGLARERPWQCAQELAPALERVQSRYVEVRKGLVNSASVEAEAAKARIKSRARFAALDTERAHHVLRPLTAAIEDTASDSVSPTLVALRDAFANRLRAAEALAHDRLDEQMSELSGCATVRVESRLAGRDIETRSELDQVVKELEELVGQHLDRKTRVRLV